VDPPREDRLERLTALVRAQRGALMAVARSEGMTAEESLECVQDALCTFLARDPDPADHDLATLKTMVRNAARNARRRHHRLKPHDDLDDLSAPRPRDEAPSAEELLASAEEIVRLRACVLELCGVQRAVVTLRLLEERSGEDVAVALGLARSHVDVLVHRAKASLRTCMRVSGGGVDAPAVVRRAAGATVAR
jgi:RNA polymerase sigma-70 factor, ECF subfamily